MIKVLIIGATGSVGRVTVKSLLQTISSIELSVFSRHVTKTDFPQNVHIFKGNVMNPKDLESALQGQNIVFAALSGDLVSMAQKIVEGMKKVGVSRLLFISSMGIYDEIPASIGAHENLKSNPALIPYRKAADVVENSGLDYTIIRPGWFNNGPVSYEITLKGQPFGGHDVSRASIADLVTKIVSNPTLYTHESVGINSK